MDRRVALFSATAVVITAVLGASVTWVLLRPPSLPVSRLTITTPGAAALSIDGVLRDVVITPDGSRVVRV